MNKFWSWMEKKGLATSFEYHSILSKQPEQVVWTIKLTPASEMNFNENDSVCLITLIGFMLEYLGDHGIKYGWDTGIGILPIYTCLKYFIEEKLSIVE